MEQQLTGSPLAPAPATSSASPSVAVVPLADNTLSNGVDDDRAKDVRPQQVEHDKGECADEQVDHPGFRVGFEHAKLKDGRVVVRSGLPDRQDGQEAFETAPP